jgi:hypothetical protein
LALQRRPGIDLSTDGGELSRFDINHPETNGMIELEFVSAITRSDLARMQTVPHLKFRRQPAGVVVGEVSEGSLDLVSVYQTTRRLADGQVKFTVTSPYMLARTLLDEHYGDLRSLAFALADVLAAQIREIDADVIQVDEASVPGQPQDSGLAAEVINRLLDAVPRVPAVHLHCHSGRVAVIGGACTVMIGGGPPAAAMHTRGAPGGLHRRWALGRGLGGVRVDRWVLAGAEPTRRLGGRRCREGGPWCVASGLDARRTGHVRQPRRIVEQGADRGAFRADVPQLLQRFTQVVELRPDLSAELLAGAAGSLARLANRPPQPGRRLRQSLRTEDEQRRDHQHQDVAPAEEALKHPLIASRCVFNPTTVRLPVSGHTDVAYSLIDCSWATPRPTRARTVGAAGQRRDQAQAQHYRRPTRRFSREQPIEGHAFGYHVGHRSPRTNMRT